MVVVAFVEIQTFLLESLFDLRSALEAIRRERMASHQATYLNRLRAPFTIT
jgi:hypothetical protein